MPAPPRGCSATSRSARRMRWKISVCVRCRADVRSSLRAALGEHGEDLAVLVLLVRHEPLDEERAHASPGAPSPPAAAASPGHRPATRSSAMAGARSRCSACRRALRSPQPGTCGGALHAAGEGTQGVEDDDDVDGLLDHGAGHRLQEARRRDEHGGEREAHAR